MIKISPYVTTLTQKAIDHLLKDGFTMDTIKENQLGSSLTFGYETRRMLDNPIIERGISTKIKAKLKHYPIFSNREIMYPLIDVNGEVLGHSGRSLTWKKSDPFPKYLNSPTSIKFKKSTYLYGENHIKKGFKLWFFEGQKDALLARQLGLMAVAPLGKITSQQIDKAKAMGIIEVVFIGDNDLAGRKFNFLGGELAEKAGLRAEVATLPKNYNDLGDGKGKIKLEEFTIKPFFNWALDSIEGLKPFTKLSFFNNKLSSLPWEHAPISVAKRHQWIKDHPVYKDIIGKYKAVAHKAITGDEINLSNRERLELIQDDFLKYIIHDIDYIVDDEIKKISYFANKPKLTKTEAIKFRWLLTLLI